MLKLSLNDFSVMFGHFLYMLVLCYIFGLLARWAIGNKDKKLVYFSFFLIASGAISAVYQQLFLLFNSEFPIIFSDIPLIDELSKRQLNTLMFFRGIVFSIFIYLIVYYLDLIDEKQKSKLEIEA